MKELVLSLCGGGVRSFLQLGILERLIHVFPHLLQHITMFAGTSAGSFITIGLAKEDLDFCKKMLNKESVKEIFSRSWGAYLGSGLLRPKYDNIGLSKVLSEALGDTTLGDLKSRVFVTTFDLQGQLNSQDPMHHNFGIRHWCPKFYDNFPDSPDLAVKLHEIALESSAAPYYFPSRGPYVDGGVYANNPSAHAITRLVREGCALEDITLLSIGSGNTPFHVDPSQSEHWGLVQWSSIFLNVIMDAPSEAAVIMSSELLGERYHRCNPILPKEFELDDASAIDQLLDIAAKTDLLPTLDFLYKHWFPDLPRMLPAEIQVDLPNKNTHGQ